jgi:hypothetical protein
MEERFNRRTALEYLLGASLALAVPKSDSYPSETQPKKYSKDELLYTAQEFYDWYEHPKKDSPLIKKAELIHKNPEQALQYLSKSQREEFDLFYKALQDAKPKDAFLDNLVDSMVRKECKKNYPFINTEKPSRGDALIIYLHEINRSKYEKEQKSFPY